MYICYYLIDFKKNYISGKNLSSLDIYISICLLLLSLLDVFIIIIIIIIIIIVQFFLFCFFCNLWRLVNANCNFCIFIFCIIFTLLWLVIIRNMLLTYLLTYLFEPSWPIEYKQNKLIIKNKIYKHKQVTSHLRTNDPGNDFFIHHITGRVKNLFTQMIHYIIASESCSS